MITRHVYLANTNSNDAIHVYSPDTDVFVLLSACEFKISGSILMHRSNNDIYNISDFGKQLGEMKAESILGIHAFTGCDVTEKFMVKAKLHG